jgi:hypothetical protein
MVPDEKWMKNEAAKGGTSRPKDAPSESVKASS